MFQPSLVGSGGILPAGHFRPPEFTSDAFSSGTGILKTQRVGEQHFRLNLLLLHRVVL